MKKSNPHLKESLMDVVDNQIRNDDPPETRQTFNRLISQGISEFVFILGSSLAYPARIACITNANYSWLRTHSG
jgi:hypothetical protein